MNRVDPGPGYRLLEPQEALRTGDEYLTTYGARTRPSRPIGAQADGLAYRRAIRTVDGRPGWRWLDAGEALTAEDRLVRADDDPVEPCLVAGILAGDQPVSQATGRGRARRIEPTTTPHRRSVAGIYEVNTSGEGRISETFARRAAWDAEMDAEMAARETVILAPIDHEDYV